MNKQVFWSVDWKVYRRGRGLLRKLGFHVVTKKAVIKANGLTCWYALVPEAEFRKANKVVRTF